MDVFNVSSHNTIVESLLHLENRRKANELIPFDVIVAMFTITGLIGNIFVMYFYTKKTTLTPTTKLIVVLAGIDTFMCFSMPKSIIVCEYIYSFRSDVLCKLYITLNYATSVFSCFTLGAIGLFRYRLVCKPLAPQFSIRDSNIFIGLSFAATMLLTLPGLTLYKVVEENITVRSNVSLVVYQCGPTKEHTLKPFVLITHLVHFAIFFGGLSLLLIFYGMIRKAVYKNNKRKRSLSSKIIAIPATPSSEIYTEERVNLFRSDDDGETPGNCTCSISSTVHSEDKIDPLATANNYTLGLRDTPTTMLFVIHVVFIISFAPYFAVSFYSAVDSKFAQQPTIFTRLCFNSYLLNSITNPFIYGLFNLKFRNFVKEKACSLVILMLNRF